MGEAELGGLSPPCSASMDETITPPSTSDGMEGNMASRDDLQEPKSCSILRLPQTDDAARDLMEIRTTSTATLHRLDMSPAPSSTLTGRRSVSRCCCSHRANEEHRRHYTAQVRCFWNAGGKLKVRGTAVSRSLAPVYGRGCDR